MRRLRWRTEGGAPRPSHHHIYLNSELYKDVMWWLQHLAVFNGEAQIPAPAQRCDIRLDATGDGGLGLFVDGAFLGLSPEQVRAHWACSECPDTPHANHWELYNFAGLLRVFPDYLRNKVVMVDNDNMAAVAGVRKLWCRKRTRRSNRGFCA